MLTPHPELNWCYYCWFNAKIESFNTSIGTIWCCAHCGIQIHAHNDGTGKGSLGEDLPRHFTKEEFRKWWEENFKMKGQTNEQ